MVSMEVLGKGNSVALVLTFLLLSESLPAPSLSWKTQVFPAFAVPSVWEALPLYTQMEMWRNFCQSGFSSAVPFSEKVSVPLKCYFYQCLSALFICSRVYCVSSTRQKFHEPMKLVLYSFLPSANMLLLRLYLFVGCPFMLLSSGGAHFWRVFGNIKPYKECHYV